MQVVKNSGHKKTAMKAVKFKNIFVDFYSAKAFEKNFFDDTGTVLL